MTNANGGGQSWALTYDEDNRTTSIHWQVLPLTDKLITNRYDALGRRISRKQDGTETRYVLDLAGSMERILCDTDASGNITAWYVHGPDLCYKVNATNGLLCYHADAQANIIALTSGLSGTSSFSGPTPVAYWKLDESSGNATDSVSTNSLANSGSIAFGSGKINNGVASGQDQAKYLSQAWS